MYNVEIVYRTTQRVERKLNLVQKLIGMDAMICQEAECKASFSAHTTAEAFEKIEKLVGDITGGVKLVSLVMKLV